MNREKNPVFPAFLLQPKQRRVARDLWIYLTLS